MTLAYKADVCTTLYETIVIYYFNMHRYGGKVNELVIIFIINRG